METQSLCKSCIALCTGRDKNIYTRGCTSYLPIPEPPPKPTPFAAVDAFLRELPSSEAKHDWSDYGIQEACHAVNGEACEAVTAAQHYKEGRDTLQHVLEELEHTGSTLIRAWMLVKGRLGE